MVFLASLSQEKLFSMNHAQLDFIGDLMNDTAGTRNSGSYY